MPYYVVKIDQNYFNYRIGPVFYIQEETLQLEEGFLFSIKFRPGDEFLIIMPITGEKIKVTVLLRSTRLAFLVIT